MTTSDRQTFLDLMKAQQPPKTADAIVVLRSWDRELTDERLKLAVDIQTMLGAGTIYMPYEDSTKSEAKAASALAEDLGWFSTVLVTHSWHAERALLTFILELGMERLYVAQVPGTLYEPFLVDEQEKIKIYQAKGDVATYNKGIEYLLWLQSLAMSQT